MTSGGEIDYTKFILCEILVTSAALLWPAAAAGSSCFVFHVRSLLSAVWSVESGESPSYVRSTFVLPHPFPFIPDQYGSVYGIAPSITAALFVSRLSFGYPTPNSGISSES